MNLFVISFHFLSSRNFFTTDVFGTLKQNKKINLIIFVPNNKLDLLRNNYEHENVKLIGIDEQLILSRNFSKFKWLNFFLISAYAVRLRAREKYNRGETFTSALELVFSYFLSRFLSRFKFVRKIVRYFDRKFDRSPILLKYFDKYNPKCILVTDVFNNADICFLKEAEANNVLSIGLVRSWDNTTTKGLMRVIPNSLIVNNKIVEEEAVKFHDVDPKNIFVSGIPQFDIYFRNIHDTREDFFKEIGADINKKLILFAPAGSILSDTDWQLCQILKDGLDKEILPKNIQFLIRKHPLGHPGFLEKFIPDENFIIEWPGTKPENSNHPKIMEMINKDQKHLVNSLFYSEILIYVNSSIGIDSLPFDKPQIMIEFDGWEKKPYIESVKHYHNEDHMQKYLRTGAVKIARTSEELLFLINNYLNNPKMDEGKRTLAIKEQLYYPDDYCGRRVANFILKQIF